MITTNVHNVVSVDVQDTEHPTFFTKRIIITIDSGETYTVTLFSNRKDKLEIKDGNN